MDQVPLDALDLPLPQHDVLVHPRVLTPAPAAPPDLQEPDFGMAMTGSFAYVPWPQSRSRTTSFEVASALTRR